MIRSVSYWFEMTIAAALVALFGLGVALIGPIFGFAISGLMAAVILFLIGKYKDLNNREWLFIISFILPLLLSFVLKISEISLFGLWQVVILFIATAGVIEFWYDLKKEKLLKLFLISFVFFLIFAVISTVGGRSNFYALFYQLISDLKPLLVLMLGYVLIWNKRTESIIVYLVRWLWLPLMIFVAFEWLTPSLYFNIFPGLLSEDPTGIFPSRAVGLFEHPSFLSSTAAFFLIFTLAFMKEISKSLWVVSLLVVAYFLLIVFSVQRQELVACVSAGFLVFLLNKPDRFSIRLLVVAVFFILAGAFFWWIFSENIMIESESWGFGTFGALEHPRAQIFSGAWFLADHHFPSGSGLGTFGGAGAEKFDTSLYEDLGFQYYWWFGVEDFLMDTYWPNSIAESGYFGASFLFFSYFLLMVYAVKRSLGERPAVRHYWTTAAALMGYMLLLSFSSPAFQDLRLFIFPAMMFGIASQVSKKGL